VSSEMLNVNSINNQSIKLPIVIRSFVLSGAARLLAVYATCFQPPPALRPRPGPMCSPSNTGVYNLWAQLSMRFSLARCQWCGPVLQVEPLVPAICYPRRWLSPHPDAPNPGVMARDILWRGHGRTLLYLHENLIS